tara:strand:+ start:827 stop:1063 length:237 start_codon:yes stop_codon:yes gene_type:complete
MKIHPIQMHFIDEPVMLVGTNKAALIKEANKRVRSGDWHIDFPLETEDFPLTKDGILKAISTGAYWGGSPDNLEILHE